MSEGDNHDGPAIDCPSCGMPILVSDELTREIHDAYLRRQLDELVRDIERRLVELRAELAATPQAPALTAEQPDGRPKPRLG